MTVFTIRSHKRYAVRQFVGLKKQGGKAVEGLMIELSSEGVRISNLKRGEFAMGDPVVLELDDTKLKGRIRWAHDGVAGVRLDTPLFSNELSQILARGRGQDEVVRYGT